MNETVFHRRIYIHFILYLILKEYLHTYSLTLLIFHKFDVIVLNNKLISYTAFYIICYFISEILTYSQVS